MTYEYHSVIFNGPVQVTYNEHGILVAFEVMDRHEVKEVDARLEQFKNFYHEAAFLASATEHKLKMVKVDKTPSFEQFYDAYKNKDGGRLKAEQAWNKLNKTDKILALAFIPKLDQKKAQTGEAKPYAQTYLNQRRWIQ
jgi:hypothetical protein